MPTVIEETGSGSNPNANSLASVAEVDAIAEESLSMPSWAAEGAEETDDKKKAVIQATKIFKRWVPWDGAAAVYRQPLPWPRVGTCDENGFFIDSNVVPTCVKEALALMADALLEDAELEEDAEVGLSSLKVDVIALNFDRFDRPGVLPLKVKAALKSVALFATGFTAKLKRT